MSDVGILIQQCTDPLRWYHDKIGEIVPFLSDEGNEWKSREPSGCVNFVQYNDGELTELYWECKYCGENSEPGCHECVRVDGAVVSDELAQNQ